MTTSARRSTLFVAIAASCVALAVVYFLLAVRRTAAGSVPAALSGASPGSVVTAASGAASSPSVPSASASPSPSDSGSASASAAAAIPAPTVPRDAPFLLFRRTALDISNGAVGIAALDAREKYSLVTALRCLRVHMAAGHGVCMANQGGTAFKVRLFDGAFAVRHELPLPGVPSRVQVAPGGRLAATTVFVAGHSYADAGFSTQTSFIDLATGTWLVENMETFTVRRDGTPLSSIDFNFWGVTFQRDGRGFYATLGTGGRTFLVHGNVEARAVDVIADDVECPSLSPDNTRIAFKHRSGGGFGPARWELWVMDLKTRARQRLTEARSVDDQVQWLDNGHLLYALPSRAGGSATTDQWTVATDGTGEPALYMPQAYSASVIQPADAGQ